MLARLSLYYVMQKETQASGLCAGLFTSAIRGDLHWEGIFSAAWRQGHWLLLVMNPRDVDVSARTALAEQRPT